MSSWKEKYTNVWAVYFERSRFHVKKLAYFLNSSDKMAKV